MGDKIYHSPFTLEQLKAAEGKGPRIMLLGNVGYWFLWNIEEMRYVQTEYPALIGDINEMSAKVNLANDAATQAKDASEAAKEAEENVLGVQAALHLRRRVIVGTATDAELLMPGDTLIITDDSSVVHTTDYQDLLLEAQKAAAEEENDLETIAVLSVVNATNLRQTEDGLLWTTDTLADFRAKLTAFAAAAVAAGYVDADGQCMAIWSQAQAWIIEGELLPPLEAETKDYLWRKAAPKTEYDAIKERLAAIEAQLGQAAGSVNTLITGGTRQ